MGHKLMSSLAQAMKRLNSLVLSVLSLQQVSG